MQFSRINQFLCHRTSSPFELRVHEAGFFYRTYSPLSQDCCAETALELQFLVNVISSLSTSTMNTPDSCFEGEERWLTPRPERFKNLFVLRASSIEALYRNWGILYLEAKRIQNLHEMDTQKSNFRHLNFCYAICMIFVMLFFYMICHVHYNSAF